MADETCYSNAGSNDGAQNRVPRAAAVAAEHNDTEHSVWRSPSERLDVRVAQELLDELHARALRLVVHRLLLVLLPRKLGLQVPLQTAEGCASKK